LRLRYSNARLERTVSRRERGVVRYRLQRRAGSITLLLVARKVHLSKHSRAKITWHLQGRWLIAVGIHDGRHSTKRAKQILRGKKKLRCGCTLCLSKFKPPPLLLARESDRHSLPFLWGFSVRYCAERYISCWVLLSLSCLTAVRVLGLPARALALSRSPVCSPG
jgi:hypothetical protein